MKISPQTWKKIEPLLTAALDMDAAERTAWLEGLHASHPEEAPLVARMLATHDRAELAQEMETVPRLVPAPLQASAFSAGDRVGPFRLLRPIGRGGMGEVWLAEQADGRVTRQVALKLPALHFQRGGWEERFRRERDILAKLAHPNIARLYDAGVGDSGQPWLAMEFVEGESIADYVKAHEVPAAARLTLFRQVLAAVSHAHRHLVVHRDLKPANILVDGAGQVKLLDFGIAKLLGESDAANDAQDLTRLGGRLMTLRYAAQEQVAGGAITTTTDIYALGVILHELVTGLSPYRAAREGRPLTEAMLLADETTVPSSLAPATVARLVRGDLDAIILKAMRRNPADRYASVELFDEDIGRHLDRRPVKARAGTWRYLAGRFAVRHRLPIAMATAVIVTMAAGVVVAERERRVAVAEKARAERHLASVRKLANAIIFDVHGEIENLAGSLKARETLVKTSLEYLDSLQAEAGNDPALLYDLAAAYRKIGDIQGQVRGANTGDLKAAIVNYEKGMRLIVALAARQPNDIRTAREHWNLSSNLAIALFYSGNAGWQPEIAASVLLAERVAALPGATRADRAHVAATPAAQARLSSMMFGNSPDAEAEVRRSIAILETLLREGPGEPVVRETLMATYESAAKVLTSSNRTAASVQEAVGYYRKAVEMVREDMAANPGDGRMPALEQQYLTALALTLSLSGQYPEADRTIVEALERGAKLLARDPRNIAPAIDYLVSLNNAALIAYRMGDPPRVIRHAHAALAVAARMPEETRKTVRVRGQLAEVKALNGGALLVAAGNPALARARRLALLTEARPLLAEAVAFVDQIRAEKLFAYPESVAREITDALRRCDEAIAKLGPG